MTPLVSVIVPCFNAAPWLRQTVESCLAQEWRHSEVIVVDDGSTDESVRIARDFGERIRLVTQFNAGASSARNAGLRVARGEYIQFLDADDLLSPDKIRLQVQTAKDAQPRSVFTCSWGRFTDRPEDAQFVDRTLWADFAPIDFLVSRFEQRTMMHPACWLTPRSVIDDAGPWNEALSLDDDGEYFTRVVLASRRVIFVPGARVYYRSRVAGSLSQQRSDRAWHSQLHSLNLSFDHLLRANDSKPLRRVAADTLQRAIYDAYPKASAARRETEIRIQTLGGSEVTYEAGPRFALIRRLVGWRLAKRLRDRLA